MVSSTLWVRQEAHVSVLEGPCVVAEIGGVKLLFIADIPIRFRVKCFICLVINKNLICTCAEAGSFHALFGGVIVQARDFVPPRFFL